MASPLTPSDEHHDTSPETAHVAARLMAKYVRVWIWSLLFGTASGLAFSYMDLKAASGWRDLTVLPMGFSAMGAVLLLIAWYCLYKYLRHVLIPEFILRQEHPERRAFEARMLERAFYYLLVAGALKLCVAIMEVVLSTRGSGSGGSF